MALRIRRGPTADRQAVTFLEGEIIYDTQERAVYVGDGVQAGGIPITSFTTEDAQDAAAALFINGTHANISFQYNDVSNSIDATVSLDGGLLNIVEDTSPQLGGNLDLNTFKISGSGNIETTGDVTIVGDVSATEFNGPLIGNVTGNLNGSVLTASQTGITEVGTLVSLAVTGAISGASLSLTGGTTTTEISTPSGDLTVNPNTDFSAGIDVTGDITCTGDLTVDTQATFNAIAGSPTLLNIDDSGTSGGRPVAAIFDAQALDLIRSGSAVEFKVNDGATTEPLIKLEAFSQSVDALNPGLNFVVYNTSTADYDINPLLVDEGGIIVNGDVNINDNLIISDRAAPLTSVGAANDFAGLIVFDDNYIYRCIADYDGVADIWVRVAFDATPWS